MKLVKKREGVRYMKGLCQTLLTGFGGDQAGGGVRWGCTAGALAGLPQQRSGWAGGLISGGEGGRGAVREPGR